MSASTAPDAAQRRPHLRRWARRGVLAALYAVFLIALLELAAFLGFRVLAGEFYSAARITEQQEQGAANVPRAGLPSPAQGPEFLRSEVVHPYLGYLPIFRPGIALADGLYNTQQEFYEPDSPVFAQDEGALTIGIVGGSVANFFSREGVEALERGLASDPRFAGKDLRIAGMAHGGYKEPQQLMALAYLLALGGSVDILINLDGFNEIALAQSDNLAQGVHYAYPRSWYFRMPPEQVLLPLIGELSYLRGQRARLAANALDSPLRHSWMYRLAWKVRDRFLRDATAEREDRLRRFDPKGRSSIALGPRREFTDTDELYAELTSLWKECSIQLDRLCRANGIRYYHVLQPNQYVAGSKALTEEELEVGFRENGRYAAAVRTAYPRLVAAGAELTAAGVHFFDATSVFADIDETLYRDDCCHFNALGNDILGSAIAEFIRGAED